MQLVPVQVAQGQLGLAAICYLHQCVLLGEQELHPLCVTTDVKKKKEALEGSGY